VFLPKPAQRQLGCAPCPAAGQHRSVELNGTVLMDPNAGGRPRRPAA
jgi:hypothetical protein